jgi:DNA-binding transcriptional LysR family regulator
MTLDPRRLLHLLAVADAGGFGKASRNLGISQPALSKSIAVLEHSVGTKLLDRSRRGASLTRYGELLVERSRALGSLIDRAAVDLRRSMAGLEGTIRIGVSPIACVTIVPGAIAQLADEAPDASISVRELEDDQLREKLLRGELDIVVSPNTPQHEPRSIVAEPLFRDRLVVAVARDNPLASRRTLTVDQIAGARFAMPTRDTAMYRTIERLFTSSGLSLPSEMIFCNSVLLIKALVRTDGAITLISDRMIEPERSIGWIKAIPLRDKTESREISFRRLKDLRPTPLVKRFIECLHAQGRLGSPAARR